MVLVLIGAVADFAEPVEEDGPGEGVPGLALVQAGGDFAAQAGVLEPVQQAVSKERRATSEVLICYVAVPRGHAVVLL